MERALVMCGALAATADWSYSEVVSTKLLDMLSPWAFHGLPALSIACLVAALIARGRLPLWLVLVSLLAPLAAVGYGILDVTSREHGRDLDYWLDAAITWALVVWSLLILGYVRRKRGPRSGRALSLIGLTLAALPFVPWVLFWLILALGDGSGLH